MANIPTVKQYITKFLHGVGHCFSDFKMNEFTEPFLQEHIVCVSLSDVSTENQGTEASLKEINIFLNNCLIKLILIIND